MKVYIMRGVPGAGKSTYIKNSLPTAVVFSTDHFFMAGGEYKFDPAKLGEAHSWNFRQYAEFMKWACEDAPAKLDGDHVARDVVIDNTNISGIEIAPYVAVATMYDVECEIITIECDPEVAGARNVHGVPPEKVKGRAKYMAVEDRSIPPYWKHTRVKAQ